MVFTLKVEAYEGEFLLASICPLSNVIANTILNCRSYKASLLTCSCHVQGCAKLQGRANEDLGFPGKGEQRHATYCNARMRVTAPLAGVLFVDLGVVFEVGYPRLQSAHHIKQRVHPPYDTLSLDFVVRSRADGVDLLAPLRIVDQYFHPCRLQPPLGWTFVSIVRWLQVCCRYRSVAVAAARSARHIYIFVLCMCRKLFETRNAIHTALS
mmetsp:Transcript_6204/g.11027  ORF Transcript_6204/g.11027 Transcript_6204/m.11027 type:complete len:211 (+) Transcript_6204:61-693(+)